MTTTTGRARPAAPAAGLPAAPPLPDDVEALLPRLRMPHTRAAAPEVLATARSQRWEPVEVLRTLFTAEVAGRERSRRDSPNTAGATLLTAGGGSRHRGGSADNGRGRADQPGSAVAVVDQAARGIGGST